MSQVKSSDQLSLKRMELQKNISQKHINLNSGPKSPTEVKVPILRAPGRPRPPDNFDALVAAKRETLLIDEAYQVIRDYCFFDKSPFITRPKAEIHHTVGLPSLTEGVLAFSVAAEKNDPYRPNMEDFRILVDPFGASEAKCCLFGVVDGYNGSNAAQFATKSIPFAIMEEFAKIDPIFTQPTDEEIYSKEIKAKVEIFQMARNMTADIMKATFRNTFSAPAVKHHEFEFVYQPERFSVPEVDINLNEHHYQVLRKAIAQAFIKVDKDLATLTDEVSLVRWSGASATVGLVMPANRVQSDSIDDDSLLLLIANLGNCHALVLENGEPVLLTEDHTVDNVRELKAISERGGKIKGIGSKKLVCGLLNTTRGLGNYGQPELRKAMSSIPFTNARLLGKDAQLIVIGTPGLWSVLSKSEISTIIVQTITYCCFKDKDPKSAASEWLSRTSSSLFKSLDAALAGSKSGNEKRRKSVSFHQDSNGFEAKDQFVSGGGTVGSTVTIAKQKEAENLKPLKQSTEEMTLHDLISEESFVLPTSSSSSNQTTDVEVARVIALNLASAALLAGSQDNITVQVILLPNYKSLSNLHNEQFNESRYVKLD